jgi:triacylglycerol esterase/lipase EstA (alpha/beta hydrolase family)
MSLKSKRFYGSLLGVIFVLSFVSSKSVFAIDNSAESGLLPDPILAVCARDFGYASFTYSHIAGFYYNPQIDEVFDKVDVYLGKHGLPTDNIYLEVWNKDTNSKVATSNNVNAASLLPAYQNYQASNLADLNSFKVSFTFNTPVNISKTTSTYSFVFRRTGSDDDLNNFCEFENETFPTLELPGGNSYSDTGNGNVAMLPQLFPLSSQFVAALFKTNGVVPTAKTPVLIIPGVLGTEIWKGVEKLWIDLARNLTDLGDQFMDPLQFDEDLNPIDQNLTVGSVIGKSEFGPFAFDYTDALVKEFENQGYVKNIDLFLFPYDWRYGVSNDNVNLLKQKIQSIVNQTGSNKIDVVAHSTGGLLVKKYVMNFPDSHHVDKAVFVGVPNTGAPKAIKVFLQGDNFGIPWLADAEMKKIAENLPVVYDLSPSEQYFNQKGSYVRVIEDKTFSIDIKDLNFSEAKDFLVLEHGLNLQAILNSGNLHTEAFDNFDLRNANVDLYAIDGCKTATIGRVIEKHSTSVLGTKIVNYDTPQLVPGDGTVPLESSTNLPINSQNKYYALDSNHSKMLGQENIRQKIVNMISHSNLSVDDSKITQDINECNLNGQAISVFSPLDINVVDQYGRHTGFNNDGSIVNEIPNAAFETMGEHKFLYLPTGDGQVYDISLSGTGTGTFTLKNENIINNNVVTSNIFSDIPVTPSLRGDLQTGESNILNLDPDGNGTIDQIIAPDTNMPLSDLLVTLKNKVQSLTIKEKLKQNLLKQITILEKKIEKKKSQNEKILADLQKKVSKYKDKGKVDSLSAGEILDLLSLLGAQSEEVSLDPEILSVLKVKIQSLNIKQNQKIEMLKNIEKLENKQVLVKKLNSIYKNIVRKTLNGKINENDAQTIIDILVQVEDVI